jgi:Fic family protein
MDEAQLSSRIEGTTATLDDVWRHESDELLPDQTKRVDAQEIINYRNALYHAEHYLERRPFCLNLILELHGILLDSVRGKDNGRGYFRNVQNYIVAGRGTGQRVTYTPPEPHLVSTYLDNWEKYYHSDRPDPLVQLAVLHAQFEIIHPFIDGNGRLGRMIIPLFLYDKKLLGQPLFYLSAYLDRHRDAYLDALAALSAPGHWNEWIAFFLQAVISQAQENSDKARAIVTLYDDLKGRAVKATRSRYAVPLLDRFFEMPIQSAGSLELEDDMPSRQTMHSLLEKLKNSGILQVLAPASGRRSEKLVLGELINLCEGRKIF